MNPTLNPEEQKKWEEQGWTPEGATQVEAVTLARALEVQIGRAATIIAQCKTSGKSADVDDVDLAISGNEDAQRRMNLKTHGLPWVVLRNGKPDLVESRVLLEDIEEHHAYRSTWKGMLVVHLRDLPKASERLPRCPLTGNVLDDFDGKLLDGQTGADWAGAWIPPLGNGRVLGVVHAKRRAPGLIPAYALTDPARAALELAGKDAPIQWQRVEQAWLSASPVEKAQAEEALFHGARPEMRRDPAPSIKSSARQDLLDWLNSCLEGQFSGVLFKLQIPEQYISGTQAPQAVRAVEVLSYLTSNGRTSELEALIGKDMSVSLRRRLERMRDVDLEAFCIDYFPDVKGQFGSGMTHGAKINLLLEMQDREEIERALNAQR